MFNLFCYFITVLVVCVAANDDIDDDIDIKYDIEEIQDGFTWKILRHTSIFDEEKGVIKYGNGILSFICIVPYLFTTVFRRLADTVTPRWVTVEECTLPTDIPFAEILKSINVNVDRLEMLRLSMFYNRTPMPKGNYTIGLSLKGLWLSAPYLRTASLLDDNPDFMTHMTNLSTLIIWGSEVPTTPETVRIKVLSLQNFAIVKSWLPICEHLQELSILNLIRTDLPEEWPEECSQLTTLRLRQKNAFALTHLLESGIDKSCKKLQTLSMPSSQYKEPPYKLLNAAKELLELSMPDNNIKDQALANFPLMKNLTHLDLSRNQLKGWSLFDLVKQLPSLQFLNLTGNQFVNLFCNFQTRLNDFASHVPSLETLILRKMPVDVHCLEKVQFSKLKYLDLSSGENIPLLDFKKLPLTNATELKVDLRGRPIKHVNFGRSHYNLLRNGNFSAFWGTKDQNATNVTLWLTSINCDCTNYWLAKTIREMPHFLSSPDLRCLNTGRKIIDEPYENMNCDIAQRARGCVMRIAQIEGEDKKISRVDCHSGSGKNSRELYPTYDNDVARTISLNVSNDKIKSLEHIKFNEWLEWIDLRHNQISRLDENDTSRLFANPERRVWLSGNLLICDCANKQFLDTLHKHREQIVDFKAIKCIDTGRPLYFVTSYKACHVGSYIILALLLILLVTSLFLWFYRRQVKIFLYSRGLCLPCLYKPDDEPGKEYDAFLLFADEDTDYVREEFLPKLEGKPNSFCVCVNYRNWTLGEWVPSAMERSVNLSKRTILLLSRNLLRAMHSSADFKLMVMAAVQQDPDRLLVVVLDDVYSDLLYTTLKPHLPRNHFKCNDSRFWGKLRYEMPHKRVSDSNVVNMNSSSPADNNDMVTKI
ncbi:protein toll-like [Pectinophora gossypiella]|uniref:protein toll-like n=1 Tax=Pectinophora gossypiella TaxID=13191 RepID=UPI00214E1736|nr:protein toll-like [Pectinophora gossypiella]